MTTDQVADLEAARRSPSLGLVGSADGRSLDMNTLQRAGVQLVGRALGADGATVRIADDLGDSCRRADRRLYRLLDLFDQVAVAAALDDVVGPPARPDPTRVPPTVGAVDLEACGIRTVLWATGFRHVHPWLDRRLTTPTGEIDHAGGIGAHPGLYALWLPFMRRRRSPFLDGIREDAEAIVTALVAHLERTAARPRTTCTTLPPRPGRRITHRTGART